MTKEEEVASIREQARQLAEAVSSTLNDNQRAEYAKIARQVADEFQALDSTPLAPARTAATVATLFAQVSRARISAISEMVDSYVVAYSLAAGLLADAWSPTTTPAAPADEAELAERIGQYL